MIRYPGEDPWNCRDQPIAFGRRRTLGAVSYAVAVRMPVGIRPRRVKSVLRRALRAQIADLEHREFEAVPILTFSSLLSMLEQL